MSISNGEIDRIEPELIQLHQQPDRSSACSYYGPPCPDKPVNHLECTANLGQCLAAESELRQVRKGVAWCIQVILERCRVGEPSQQTICFSQ